MSSINIKLETESEVIEFVKFLSKVSIHFIGDDKFTNLLHKAILSGKIVPSWLDNDIFSSYLESISKEYYEDERLQRFINSIKGCYNDSFSSVKLKPTEHFKKFCGPEWLNYNGLMSKKSAYDFVMYQISVRKVNVYDDKINVNDYLKDLLNVNVDVLSKWELVNVLDSLFVSP
jgi:hypothetical protein